MKKMKFFTLTLVSVLCLAFLGGCGSSGNSVTTDDGENVSYWETQQYDSLSGDSFIKVGESGHMQLLLNPSSGTVRWMDTATGVYQDTNMSHDEDLGTKTNAERSDLIVRYFSGSKNADAIYKSTSNYDSYSMAASREQLAYQLLDNGVRIVYTLGDDSVTYKNFPWRISDERMQEYVVQYLSDTQFASLKLRYSQLSNGDWLRGFSNDEGKRLGALAMHEMYDIFYETGQYTEELLYEDLETWEVEADEYPSNLVIHVPVEYYLDGEELVVNVDTTRLETDVNNPINQIQLLPYFITSDSAESNEEGYMFVPDGSGALMYLDSTKTRETHYQATYFDGDYADKSKSTVYTSTDSKMQLPVFGMKRADSTIFAVIEEGAEIATLDAYISNSVNQEPFSKMSLTFDIQAQQRISSGSSNASGDFYLYKATDDIYDDNITVRYFWLGKDAGYVEMAHCYSAYLKEKGLLAESVKDENPPFIVEFLGTTDKTQYFLGIPYEGTQALTTFSQAQEMLEHLKNVGVSNVKVIYSGIINGGINQRSLSGGVKFAPGLGGSSAFNKLKSYADSMGAQIYPNVRLQTVYTKAKLDNSTVAWNAINERAEIYDFDPIKHQVDDKNEFPLYFINPNAFDSYLSKVKSSYADKIGLTTMASEDLYTFIPTNYRDNHVSLSTGADILEETVSGFADGMSLMLSNPIVYAYAYADYIMDIPVKNSGMRVLDASVPFIGIVLDGNTQYSAESSNRESTDVWLNIMHAIESNAQPKFTMMYENGSLLTGTEQENYFAVDYNYWKDQIGFYYQEYRNFYDTVKDAHIVDHEIYDRNDKLRVVTYSNGVKAYFNYSDLEEVIDGVTVPAFSYLYKQ